MRLISRISGSLLTSPATRGDAERRLRCEHNESRSERKVFDTIQVILRLTTKRQGLPIVDEPPDGDAGLIRRRRPGRESRRAAVASLRPAIIRPGSPAPGSTRPPGRTSQGRPVRSCHRVGGEPIHVPQQQAACDGGGHMHVHVKRRAHGSLPMARSFLRIGDSPACRRNSSTRVRLR